jgi:hypothetical protein
MSLLTELARFFLLGLYTFRAAGAFQLPNPQIRYGQQIEHLKSPDHKIRCSQEFEINDVLRLVIKQGMILSSTGVAIGLAAALALTRLMESLLYEVSPTDPLTFTGIALLLSLVALVACWIPASRAAKLDPLIAFRHE